MSRYAILPLLLIGGSMAMVSCGSFSLYSPDRGEIVAQVGDSILYTQDLNFGVSGISAHDSVAQSKLYIMQWVNDQIEIQEAMTSLGEFQDDIEAKVMEYRKSLIKYHFQEGYISSQLDTVITLDQISQYYAQHRASFRLAGPLVKVRVARIPSQLRQSQTLRDLFQSDKQTDLNDFKELCDKNNYRFVDLSQQWTPFSEVLSMIPFSSTDFDGFLRSKKYYEVQDDQYQYMMAIDDRLYTGDLSPMEMVVGDIRHVLLHDRRAELLSAFKDSLYSSAIESGRAVVHIAPSKQDTIQPNISTDSVSGQPSQDPLTQSLN